MDQLANCPICGKLYLKNPMNMCGDCYQTEGKNEETVAAYVRDHPNTSLAQIHQDTGVKESTILRMIKAGRLIGLGIVTYGCDHCGAQITEGRLCPACSKKMLEDANKKANKKTPPKQGVGMYMNFYSKKKK